jgi:predicted  nucleic acid-binding Zn-ribbon protein
MSLSSIFAKIDELDRKVSHIASESAKAVAMSGSGSGSAASAASSSSIDLEQVLQRLAAVEGVVAAFAQPDIDAVNSRLSVLESKIMPDDIPNEVAVLQSNMTTFQNALVGHSGDIQSVAQKLNHLETVTLPHILTRLENLEHQLAQQPDQ